MEGNTKIYVFVLFSFFFLQLKNLLYLHHHHPLPPDCSFSSLFSSFFFFFLKQGLTMQSWLSSIVLYTSLPGIKLTETLLPLPSLCWLDLVPCAYITWSPLPRPHCSKPPSCLRSHRSLCSGQDLHCIRLASPQ